MSVFRVMLVTICVLLQAAGAYAQGTKPANKPSTGKTNRQIYCFAEIMQNEAEQTTKGRVSVGLVVLTRAVSGHWGPKNDICALRKPNEFHYLQTKKYGPIKKPTGETMQIARQMYADWKNGKATIEVALQQQLAGAQYFHNPSYWPRWSKTFKKKGFVANHHIYFNPEQGMVLVYK